MNVNTAANILLIAAAVIWILAKQVKAAPIKTRLLVLAPLLMGYFGIKETPASTWKSGADLAFILIGALFSIGLGLWRGSTIRVWREADGVWWRAGSKTTLYLWGALLVVRAVSAGIADATGHKAADGLGPILFSLALSFAAQNAVIAMRMSGSPAVGTAQDRLATPAGHPTVGSPVNAPADAPAWSRTGAPVGESGPVDLGQYNRYGEQNGYRQTADGGQRPGFPPQAASRHERIEQRRAARRVRRAQRRDR